MSNPIRLKAAKTTDKVDIPLVKFTQGDVLVKRANRTLAFAMNTASSTQSLVTAKAGDVTYSGQSGDDTLHGQRYMVAVRKKGQDKATLFPARLHLLRPNIKGEHGESQAAKFESYDQIMAAKSRLTEAFGGKKVKAALHARARGKLVAEALQPVSGVLGDALKTAKAEGLDQKTGSMARNLPPHDLEPPTPELAYPLEKLISSAEKAAIKPLVKALGKATDSEIQQWRANNVYPDIVINAIRRLTVAGSTLGKSEKTRKLEGLQYLLELLKLRNYTKSRKAMKPEEIQQDLPSLPDAILRKFLTTFVDSDALSNMSKLYRLSDKNRDLFVLYILVLFLHAGNMKASIVEVSREVGLSEAKTMTYFRALGATVQAKRTHEEAEEGAPGKKKGTKRYTATLKLPLAFPRRKGGRK
eukprot:m.360097 g.360097  ORF g.360097 m.360097 type:complete len:414 (+) comp18887_c0_seq1:165-1406(+)